MTHDTADRILDFVRRFIAEQGYAPSYREIAEGAGLATTCHVGAHLDRLERAGRLRRTKGVARSIVLLEDGRIDKISVAGWEVLVTVDENLPPGTIQFWQGGKLTGTIHNVRTEKETGDD